LACTRENIIRRQIIEISGETSMRFGPTELIIILVIILVLFGVGRISKIAGELGSGIKAFKQGLSDDEKKEEVQEPETTDKPGV